MEWQTRYFEGVVSLARVRSSRIVLTIRKLTLSSEMDLRFFFTLFSGSVKKKKATRGGFENRELS